jgi:prepilin-type N-terminal cleavage/methylation domain-containing protein
MCPQRQALGFSLVEIVIVLAIMAVLVAVAAVRAMSNTDEARANSLIAQVRRLNDAARVARQLNGRWPADVFNSIVPADMATLLHPNGLRAPTPAGGNWDWNGPGGDITHIGFSVRCATLADEPPNLLQLIENKFDDANVNTGWIRRVISSGRPFWCFRVE